ncbi:hypothetical protein JNW90_28955 [Micromonospora sp. STR1s_5]|nr:hypothetical protein [Micromonospora sp. STR1s_5]
MFQTSGYEISFVAETGRRGDDFDFTAHKNGTDVAVEVTHIKRDRFYVSTLRNKLQEKRTQVPADRPAVLCIFVKTGWVEHAAIEQDTQIVIDGFFKQSRRYGCVLINFETWHDTSVGPARARARRPYMHPNPYHSLPDTSFVRRQTLDELMERINERRIAGEVQDGEPCFSIPVSFVKWIRDQ